MPSTQTDRLKGTTTSVAVKAPCRVAALTNITLAGEQTVNGVAVVEGDRVLVTAQTSSVDNGIYKVSTGDWTRALDFDGNRDVVQGTIVPVVNGTGTEDLYTVTSPNPITIDTTALTFALRYGANVSYDRTAAEIAGSITPVDDAYPEGRIERYGISTSATAAVNTAAMVLLLASTIREIVFRPGTYAFNARLTMTSNKRIRVDGAGQCIWDFPGVLGVSSGEAYLVYGTGVDRVYMDDIHVRGDATQFTNNGFDTYGVLFINSTNVHLKRVSAEGVENGVHFRDGCTDCSMEDVHGYNCFYHCVASWGLDSAPNRRIKLHNCKGYSNQTLERLSPVTGVFVEETYDSDITNIEGFECLSGVRIENACDNNIANVKGYNNWKSGVLIYNYSQRNNIHGVVAFDNNRGNQDAIDTVNRGNDNNLCSGLDISVLSDNNNIANVLAYQTPATKIPFSSGSDEPWLGALIRGVTSNATARVRRIDLTSGSWGGGDAAGILHCVEASGAFNASEVIKNMTTRVPYNSGSAKPRPGDIIVGATSGATGTLLWASQQGDSSIDWGVGNSEGYLYLVSVTGTFSGAENLNNTTTSESNFATNNSAATAVDTDIATTNGATTLGKANSDGTYGRGFQKYGIGINVRNLAGTNNGDSANNITNWQCFNNDIAPISDRGYYTNLGNGNHYVFNITRH